MGTSKDNINKLSLYYIIKIKILKSIVYIKFFNSIDIYRHIFYLSSVVEILHTSIHVFFGWRMISSFAEKWFKDKIKIELIYGPDTNNVTCLTNVMITYVFTELLIHPLQQSKMMYTF